MAQVNLLQAIRLRQPMADDKVVPALAPELECPTELPPRAREEGNRIVGELTALGVLSKFDRGPLAVYCTAYAAWMEAMQAVNEYGMMIKSPSGYPVQSPYVAIANHQADVMLRLAGEFGFTPASRNRIFTFSKRKSMLLDVTKEDDPFA
jgi:P27 family predicted phage terminase small subunit